MSFHKRVIPRIKRTGEGGEGGLICKSCGWFMKVVDCKKHECYEDSLYRCICGATHLEIKHLDFIKYLKMNSLKESELTLEK